MILISFRMKEEDNKKSKIISLQLKEKIKKKPYAEQIGDTHYTYSLLKKKNELFFLTNQRLLVLVGNSSIGYARSIPDTTLLPFYHPQNIPPLKYNILLSAISTVTAQGDLLVISFVPESKIATWQFVCDSKLVAEQWKQAIEDAASVFRLSGANNLLTVNIAPQKEAVTGQVNSLPKTSESPTPAFAPQDPELIRQNAQPALPSNMEKVDPNGANYNNNFNHQAYPSSPAVPPIFNNQQKKGISVEQRGNWGKYLNDFNVAVAQRVYDQPPKVETEEAREYHMKKKSEERERQMLEEENLRIRKQQKLPQQDFSLKAEESQDKQLADYHWDYEFLKGEEQYILIERFKQQVEPLAVAIIDQLPLRQGLRKYHPIQQTNHLIKYSVRGLSLQLTLLEPAETSSFHDNTTLISHRHSKAARAEFKNANYILQCSRNKGHFRVPLMMILYYKGFQVLAKAGIHTAPEYAAPLSTLQQDIAQLEQTTRVSRELFEDEDNLKVVAGDSRWFEKINRSQNGGKRFDCCFLTDIHHFLPQDLSNNRQREDHLQLRPELLQEETFDGILLAGSNILDATNKFTVTTETKNALKLLSDVSAMIPSKTATLLEDLENLDVIFTNSQELSAAMHSSGLSIRNLGILLNLCKVPWLSSLLQSEIAARSAKYILSYQLQETALTLGLDSLEKAKEFQVEQALSWLNRILGIGPESEGIWGQIMRQAQCYFKASVRRQSLNLGYLFQALQYHGGVRVRGGRRQSFFKSNNIFGQTDFIQFRAKPTVYDPGFTEHYSEILSRLDNLSYENYQYLAGILNVGKRVPLESHYFLNGIGEQLMTYLANWLSPQQAPFLYPHSPHELPSKYHYQLQLTAIKWELKAGRLDRAETIRDSVVEHLNEWLGQVHPILTELYDIFSHYFQNEEDKLRNSLAFARSSLTNQEKLLGTNHFKLADAYYSLGDTQLQYSKKNEALSSYKKAMTIIQDNSQHNSEAYLEITLKIAKVLLLSSSFEEAEHFASRGLEVAQNLNLKDKFLAAVQMLSRCFELNNNWDAYRMLVQKLISTLSLLSDSLSSFQNVLKIIFFPALRALARRSKEIARSIQVFLKALPQLPTDQNEALTFLKRKIDERSFPWSLLEYIDEAERIIGQPQLSGISRRWKGFSSELRNGRGVDFLCQLQALRLVVGKGFIEGVLENE